MTNIGFMVFHDMKSKFQHDMTLQGDLFVHTTRISIEADVMNWGWLYFKQYQHTKKNIFNFQK